LQIYITTKDTCDIFLFTTATSGMPRGQKTTPDFATVIRFDLEFTGIQKEKDFGCPLSSLKLQKYHTELASWFVANTWIETYTVTVLGSDVHETFQAETETRPETQRSETEMLGILFEARLRPRRCSCRDLDRDVWYIKIIQHNKIRINCTGKL